MVLVLLHLVVESMSHYQCPIRIYREHKLRISSFIPSISAPLKDQAGTRYMEFDGLNMVI